MQHLDTANLTKGAVLVHGAGIEEGGIVRNQSDWNESDTLRSTSCLIPNPERRIGWPNPDYVSVTARCFPLPLEGTESRYADLYLVPEEVCVW